MASEETKYKKILENLGYKVIEIYTQLRVLKGSNINSTYVKYECDNGHLHDRPISKVLPSCSFCRKPTIKNASELALKHEGKFLSETFTNTITLHLWECKNKHQFNMRYLSVKKGNWCPQCYKDNTFYTLEDIQKLAESKGGRCTSTSMTKTSDRLEFECDIGHRWTAVCRNIITGRWCNVCNVQINERTCTKILEFIYKKPFPKIRPDWLLSSYGGNMEIDGYCEELKLGFEYQGKQHYEHVPHFHRTIDIFEKCQQRDKEKHKLCKDNNVKLIIIPYTVKNSDLYTYIKERCENIPNDTPKTIDYNILNLRSVGNERNKQIQEIIDGDEEMKGGKLLSTYISSREPMNFICKNNHTFTKHYEEFSKQKIFCKECEFAPFMKQLYDFCKKYELEMAEKYINSMYKMKWKCCRCNGTFDITYGKLKIIPHDYTNICRLCGDAVMKQTKQIKEFCIKNNLELISEYTGSLLPSKWKCIKCNKIIIRPWAALLANYNGCACSKINPMNAKIQQFCTDHDLELLSTYTNSKTHMQWKCTKCNDVITRSWDSINKRFKQCNNCFETE
jgi:hypothetical protein